MHKNYFTLAALSKLFSSRLSGTRFLDAYSHQPDELILSFLPETKNVEPINIRFITDVQRGCLFLAPYANPPKKNVMHFFPSLQGTVVHSVGISRGDRILYVHFDVSENRTIALAMFGKRGGNALLLDEKNTIEESYKTPKQLIGTLFDDSAPEWQLLLNNKEHICDSLRKPGAVKPLLSKALPFLGGELVDEILFRSQVDTASKTQHLSDMQYAAVSRSAEQIIDECINHTAPQVVFHRGKIFFSLISLRHIGDARTIACENVSEGIRRWFAESAKQEHVAEDSDRYSTVIAGAIERTERAIVNVEKDIEREDERLLRRKGELLTAHAHAIKQGAKSVVFDNVEIVLDPHINTLKNAASYFELAKKRKSAVAQSRERLEKLRSRLKQFRQLNIEFEQTETSEERKQLAITYNQLFKTAERMDPNVEPKYPYRYFQLSDGCEVFVGKNAKQNDELTFHFAKQNDLWFHARGVEGSHTVLRWSRRSDPPKEYILRAAAIAAFYSKAKNSKYVPVAYTQRKYVHKPRGAKPGAVAIAREEVVMVEPGIPENLNEEN